MISTLFQKVMPLLMLSSFGFLVAEVTAGEGDIFKQAQQALDQQEYKQAQQLFSQLNSIEAYFGEGTACYRLKDYGCAQQAFASAAWAASEKQQKAKAVFNLANSYFFSGDYDQAATLYRDAELLGIESDVISINLQYANSMQAAIQRHLKHIRQSFDRAIWRAAVNDEKVPSLADFLSTNDSLISLVGEQTYPQTQYRISAELIQQELSRQLGLNSNTSQSTSGRWVETDRVLPRSTAKMINRLFEMELGINSPLTQAQTVEGKRRW